MEQPYPEEYADMFPSSIDRTDQSDSNIAIPTTIYPLTPLIFAMITNDVPLFNLLHNHGADLRMLFVDLTYMILLV
jgi:hypothetical protein